MSTYNTASAAEPDVFAPFAPTSAGGDGPPYRIPVRPLTNFYLSPPNPDGPGGDGPDPDGPDGSGSGSGENGCRCGPDVTEWFRRQLVIIKAWAENNFWTTAPIVPNEKLRHLMASLRFEKAGLKVDGCCPRCAACDDTVTLCGTCVDVTELGNIAYGYGVGRSMAMVLWGGFYAEVRRAGRGFDKLEDVTAAIAGALTRDKFLGTAGAMCLRLKGRPTEYMTPPYDEYLQMLEKMREINNRAWCGQKGDILADWDASPAGKKFGGWTNFLWKAFRTLDQQGGLLAFLGTLTDDDCGTCREVVDPGDLEIKPNGTPFLNGKAL